MGPPLSCALTMLALNDTTQHVAGARLSAECSDSTGCTRAHAILPRVRSQHTFNFVVHNGFGECRHRGCAPRDSTLSVHFVPHSSMPAHARPTPCACSLPMRRRRRLRPADPVRVPRPSEGRLLQEKRGYSQVRWRERAATSIRVRLVSRQSRWRMLFGPRCQPFGRFLSL